MTRMTDDELTEAEALCALSKTATDARDAGDGLHRLVARLIAEARQSRAQRSPEPQKITEQTTLAELAMQRALLGCSSLTLIADMKGERAAIVQHPTGGLHIGRGVTEAIAIEAAFSSLRRALLPEPLKELLR